MRVFLAALLFCTACSSPTQPAVVDHTVIYSLTGQASILRVGEEFGPRNIDTPPSGWSETVIVTSTSTSRAYESVLVASGCVTITATFDGQTKSASACTAGTYAEIGF